MSSKAPVKTRVYQIFRIVILISIPLFLYFVFWLMDINQTINNRIEKNWFLPPIEYYSAPFKFFAGQKFSQQDLRRLLKQNNYRPSDPHRKIRRGEFDFWSLDFCLQNLSHEIEDLSYCVVFNTPQGEEGSEWNILAFNEMNTLIKLLSGNPFKETQEITLPPQLFAQFYDGKPLLRRLTTISETPLNCLNAITSIEDKDFLTHQGVSLKAIARAFLSLIAKGRVTQGGSTITQQLVKNYFLTSERTLQRKFTEFFMALLLEAKVSKDIILQNYLNVIYMGQNGPFQVRGYGAAAEHYFNKDLEQLNLPECALLAAIVNSPGRFNPFKKDPSPAIKRRERVLTKMKENNHIDELAFQSALKSPLPNPIKSALTEPAPYFVNAIQEELKNKDIDPQKGLKIFTTMIPQAQESAMQAVRKGLKEIKKKNKNIQKLAENGKELQALLIAAEASSGQIIALVGGSSFKKTQYNRAISGHRQVGSVMKPLVYLAALESLDEEGNSYHPLTKIEDKPFVHKYEGQSWSPKNYENKAFGTLPLFVALKNSINISTAKVGLQIGLNSILDVSKRMGVHSQLKTFPSLTLGAFELYPREVLEVYSSFARYGSYIPSQLYTQIVDNKDNKLIGSNPKPEQRVSPQTAAVLVGMLRQTILTGTGRSIPYRGFRHPAAGKTGTTSDTKDAWFAGFTPYVVCIVWVGYDDNTPHGLTGSSGALPIWTEFMKSYASQFPADEFPLPEGTVRLSINHEKLVNSMAEPDLLHTEGDVDLVFRSENAP